MQVRALSVHPGMIQTDLGRHITAESMVRLVYVAQTTPSVAAAHCRTQARAHSPVAAAHVRTCAHARTRERTHACVRARTRGRASAHTHACALARARLCRQTSDSCRRPEPKPPQLGRRAANGSKSPPRPRTSPSRPAPPRSCGQPQRVNSKGAALCTKAKRSRPVLAGPSPRGPFIHVQVLRRLSAGHCRGMGRGRGRRRCAVGTDGANPRRALRCQRKTVSHCECAEPRRSGKASASFVFFRHDVDDTL